MLEIEHLQSDYGIEAVFFPDEAFISGRKWVEDFCDARKKEKKGTKPFSTTFSVMPTGDGRLMLQKRIFDYAPQF